MPIFVYRAADQRGQTIDGVMEAADLRSVVERLQHDAYFPIQQVEGLEEKLKKANVKYEFYRYKAKHAFANETLHDPSHPIAYDASAAETAWARTMSFFNQHLKGSRTQSA